MKLSHGIRVSAMGQARMDGFGLMLGQRDDLCLVHADQLVVIALAEIEEAGKAERVGLLADEARELAMHPVHEVERLVGPDGFELVHGDALLAIVEDKDVHALLGVGADLLLPCFVLEADLVVPLALVSVGADDRPDLVGGRILLQGGGLVAPVGDAEHAMLAFAVV